MANSVSYNGDKVDAAIANLDKVTESLQDLYTAMIRFDSSFNTLTYLNNSKVWNRINKMATKYDENDEPQIDAADEAYYKNNYGTPLCNALSNVETLKNAVPNIKNRIVAVSDAFVAVKAAVSLYEEIPPVPPEELGLSPSTGNATSNPNYVDGEYKNIVEQEGIGKADVNIDLNGDGIPDINIDTNGDGKADTNIDLNGDGVPDLNVDTNGDGKADLNIDINGDGVPDLNIDIDGDGKADTNIDTNKDGQSDTNVDIDGDGQANTNIDTNGDGISDTNIDLDGDGKADVNVDVNGDGQADLNIDTNGDGIADINIDANRNGIIDSEEEKEEGTVIPILPIPPIPKDEDDEEEDDDVESEDKKDKTGEENADDLVDIGEVVIPDIGGEDDVKPGPEEGNKGAGAISNIGTAIADSVTSVEDELLDGVIEAEEKPSIPDALLGGNGSHGMSEFDASGSYKNAQGPAAAQAGVGVAGVAALGIAAASGGTAISGVIEENAEESDLTKDELARRKRIRTIITSSSLVILSLGFTLTQILRPGSIITILLFGIAILISAVASVFGTNIGKTITSITSLLLLFITFLLAAFNVVSPLGYIIALIALLTIFLVVYIFDLFKEFVDNKVMIPSFVAVVTLNAFGLLKVFNVVNWLIYLLLAALGIAVYLWYERYYGQGFEVLNKLKNEDKRKFFN